MVRASINCIVILVCYAIVFSGTVHSTTTSDLKEVPNNLETSSELNSLQYHLVTVPSTNRKRVDAMCIKFLSLIPKARLIPKTVESTVYRLITDTFETVDPAKKRKAELLRFCESPFVMKSDAGYTVIAGSQLTETLAMEEQMRLASKNISTTIRELRLPLKHWQMKSSESYNLRDAVDLASKLVRIGVITTIEQSSR